MKKMKKFRVTAAVPVFVTVTVDAKDKESAIDSAWEYFGLTNYAGNGGIDKLIGTGEQNVSIDAGEAEPIEDCGFSITVEEVEL